MADDDRLSYEDMESERDRLATELYAAQMIAEDLRASRDELKATVARARAVLNRSTYVDDFSRYVVTVDEVRAALRAEASDA